MILQTPIEVLVVDDSAFIRKVLTGALGAFGLKVVGTAENGRQALQSFEDLRPDAIVLDIMMPELNGIETLREIRSKDANVTVVMITSSEDEAYVNEARSAGASGFLHKPIKVDQLYEDIRSNFRRLMAERNPEQDLDEHYVKYVLGKKFSA